MHDSPDNDRYFVLDDITTVMKLSRHHDRYIVAVMTAQDAGSHPRERTFVNVTYAVDGAWGIGGRAYSNAELGEAIQRGAS